jgi:hypothetical protein
MTFISGNPYKIAAIQKAKRLQEEKIALEKWNNLTEEEQVVKENESRLNSLTSARVDTHAMQSNFYGRKY